MNGPPTPAPCELERRIGDGARAGEAAPERACVAVRERDMPVLRSAGARWCGCVGVRKSGGRLWREAVGVVMLLAVVFGAARDRGNESAAAAAGAVAGGARTAEEVYGAGMLFSPFGSGGSGAVRRRDPQSPLSPKLRRPHSRIESALGGT